MLYEITQKQSRYLPPDLSHGNNGGRAPFAALSMGNWMAESVITSNLQEPDDLISRNQQVRKCTLRQRATSRKIAGSIPDGVTGNFH
jgi:hypothetical protein